MIDSFGHGILEGGYYELYYDNELIADGGSYAQSESSSPFGSECYSASPSVTSVPTTITDYSQSSKYRFTISRFEKKKNCL